MAFSAPTKMRLLQITASLPSIEAQLPANPSTGPSAVDFAANDMSGSLAYFAKSIQNIHGKQKFGQQTPGLIQFDAANDVIARGNHSAAAQTVKLAQHDGTSQDALAVSLISTSTATASEINIINAGGTAADAIEIKSTSGGLKLDSLLGGVWITGDDSTLDIGEGSAAGDTRLSITHDSGTVANELIVLKNAAGTEPTAISVEAAAGGVEIKSAQGKGIDIGRPTDASILVFPDAGAANRKITFDVATSTNAKALELKASLGGIEIASSFTVVTGSSAAAFTFSGDGSMTSGNAGAGMLFGRYAEYADFRSKAMFGAGTSVVQALNVLADNVTGATATIFSGSVAAAVVAGGNSVVSKVAGDNVSLVQSAGDTKVSVYVNGQLLRSSSIGAANDYVISATNTIQFAFLTEIGDEIYVIDRS